MNKAVYEEKTEQLLLPITEAGGYELVDVEFVKEGGSWYLRGYIDKSGGVTVDDCERVSRSLEAELDREDFIAEPYILEISSPGLGRPLKKDKDFVRNKGKDVEIRLFRPQEHEKNWEGTLSDWDAQTITLLTDQGTDSERDVTFSRENIALIREAFDW